MVALGSLSGERGWDLDSAVGWERLWASQSIRRNDGIGVVEGAVLETAPLLNNVLEDAAAVDDHGGVGGGSRAEHAGLTGERTWVGLVQEERSNRDLGSTDDITGDVSNPLEDVGTDIPTAEGWEVPVGLDGSEGRVVGVDVVIGGTDERLGEEIGDDDGLDTVGNGVGGILVEVDEEEGVVHEVLVGDEGLDEGVEPVSTVGETGVVSIVQHVGGDEDVLGELVVEEILAESLEILDDVEALLLLGVGVVEHRGIVLADVVVGTGARVDQLETLETSVWQVLLVGGKGDASIGQDIPDVGDVGWDLVEVVVVHTEVLTTIDGAVLGLGRMGGTIVVGEGETLSSELLHVGCSAISNCSSIFFFSIPFHSIGLQSSSFPAGISGSIEGGRERDMDHHKLTVSRRGGEVSVLHHDVDEAVEDLALDIGGWAGRLSGGQLRVDGSNGRGGIWDLGGSQGGAGQDDSSERQHLDGEVQSGRPQKGDLVCGVRIERHCWEKDQIGVRAAARPRYIELGSSAAHEDAFTRGALAPGTPWAPGSWFWSCRCSSRAGCNVDCRWNACLLGPWVGNGGSMGRAGLLWRGLGSGPALVGSRGQAGRARAAPSSAERGNVDSLAPPGGAPRPGTASSCVGTCWIGRPGWAGLAGSVQLPDQRGKQDRDDG